MLGQHNHKPNAVRHFDDETYAVTIARRELAAIESLLNTAQREIEAAQLSETAQNLVGEQFSRLYQRGEALRRAANQELKIFTACAILRGEPEMVAA